MSPSSLQGRLSPSSLCPECALLFERAWKAGIAIPPGHPRWDTPLDRTITFPWHPTFAAVRHSATVGGCHFCTLICRYRVPLTPTIDEQNPLTIDFNHDGLAQRNDMVIIATEGNRTGLEFNIRYCRDRFWEGRGSTPVYGHHDRDGRIPPGLFDMLRDWTTHCQADHPECNRSLHEAVPSRVIEISHEDEKQLEIRLVDVDADVRGRYATLSHCWGPNPDLSRLPRTTGETVADHYTRIPYENLSATFKDAIAVTHQLGLQYLWIDSLCIIQQDTADWEKESVKMADIYANSFVTIAATGSRGKDEGLYLLRSEQEMTPVVWRTPEAGQTLAFHPFTARDYFEYETGGIARPLYSRAWCMQELTLSRRVLHFLPGQVIWDCSTKTSYEFEKMGTGCLLQQFQMADLLLRPLPPGYAFVDVNKKQVCSAFQTTQDLPHSLRYTDIAPGRPMTVCFGHPQRSGDLLQNLRQVFTKVNRKKPAIGTKASREAKSIHDEWRSLVENYSLKDITYRDDRLPAIWSFAERMRNIVKPTDRYLNGIWRQDIPHGLTFMLYTPSSTPEVSRPLPPAPSWSWAAHEGRIRYYGDGRLHKKNPKYPDPLRRPEFVDYESEVPGAAAMGRSTAARLTLKCISAPIIPTPDSERPKTLLRQGYVEIAVDSEQLLEEVSGKEIRCIHLMDFCGLLVRLKEGGNGEFERVGLCYARHQGDVKTEEIEKDYLKLGWEEGLVTLI